MLLLLNEIFSILSTVSNTPKTAGRGTVAQAATKRLVPSLTALECGAVPIVELAKIACREGQATIPLFRIHRWFARRLSSQFRAILSALTLAPEQQREFWNVYGETLDLRDAVVLDPFVGGGTSATEVVRGEGRFIGYDIDPVAAFITRSELMLGAADGFVDTALQHTRSVADDLERFHQTLDSSGNRVTVLHHFWVETRSCASCGIENELHTHFQLAHDRVARQCVFCRSCHLIQDIPLTRKRFSCSCGVTTTINAGPLQNGTIRCSSCHAREPLAKPSAHSARPLWRLFAQEYLAEDGTRRFKRASDADRELARSATGALRETERVDGVLSPDRLIPHHGRKDQRPLIHGFSRYQDLFNDRQLLHLTRLGHRLKAATNPTVRRLLALAFSEHLTTNCMYTAYAFGYRRTTALFSIHGYRHVTRPVEINPWLDGIGRGTYPNAIRKIGRAIDFANSPRMFIRGRKIARVGTKIVVQAVSDSAADVIKSRARAAVIAESSTTLRGLPNASVDIVLTDPPYLDNIAYSELSDFYLAWHQRLGIAPKPFDDATRCAPQAENLGLARRDLASTDRYRADLTKIFAECRRVLKSAGVMAFTYHHDSALAWDAVAHALFDAGLRCTGVLPLRGEGNGGLHSFEGTIKWDAVLVCRPHKRASRRAGPLRVSDLDIAAARETVRGYRERLRRTKGIRFASPDAENLFRAVLGGRASRTAGIPLSDALLLPWREKKA